MDGQFQLESSLVRIYSSNWQVVGAGFLVADQQVLTCAHVAAEGLGLSDENAEPLNSNVFMDFPLIKPELILTARVTFWRPEEDIAGLELDGNPPPEAHPAPLVSADDLWGHDLRIVGFPQGREMGVSMRGEALGRNAAGWVQIESKKEVGYSVKPGFSGTPVWDEELQGVAGMVVAADTQPGVRAAFLIPTDVLAQAWPAVVPRALLDAEMDRLRARQGEADRQRREMRDRQRVVNLRPLDVTHIFKDRHREIAALCDYLSDERVRLISVVGRSGMGKTALVSRVLADLERGMLPVPSGQKELSIDGILYLSARSTGLGLERIYVDVSRMLVEPTVNTLATRWCDQDTPLIAKIQYLLEAMQDGLYLILLDSLEDALTEKGGFAEEGLRLFIECCLTQPSGARLIVTSREQVKLAASSLQSARTIAIREGLPEDDATALLRDLDPQGELGLLNTPEDDLRSAARLTRGIPRALELIAGILDRDPTATLRGLLANERLFGEKVVERLVSEGYRRLGDDERRVVEALAVFGRPMAETAVAYLLHPWFPGLNVQAALRRLVRAYFVSASRATEEYSLHPLDDKYAYSQLPGIDAPEAWSRKNLELRAAQFYASIRKPEGEWKTIDDLAPQLAEFEHRVRARDYEGACHTLEPIDYDHLHVWGYYSQVVRMREKLSGQLTTPLLRAANFGGLGRAYHALGQIERSIEYYEMALTSARELGDRRLEGARLGSLSNAYFAIGQVERAIELNEAALRAAREAGDREGEARHLGNLGFIKRVLGFVDEAIRLSERSIDIFDEIGYHRGRGSRLGNLGRCYHDLGQLQRAASLYEQALVSAKTVSYPREVGVQMGNLGDVQRDLGHMECAIDLCKQALDNAREIGYRGGEQRYLSSLAYAHRALGEFKQAVDCYEEALALADELEDRRGRSYQYLGLGRTLLAMDELAVASRYCQKSRDLDVPETSYEASLVLAIILANQDRVLAAGAFAEAETRCRAMLEKTARLYRPRYVLAAALVGRAVCDPQWADQSQHGVLLNPAISEYKQALDVTNALGIVRDALRDVGLIRAAGIEGLEPIFDLLEAALEV